MLDLLLKAIHLMIDVMSIINEITSLRSRIFMIRGWWLRNEKKIDFDRMNAPTSMCH